MTMQLTSVHVERLRDNLRSKPLQEGEIRRVVGAGEQYIALTSVTVEAAEYTKMYALKIDDVSYTIFAKVPQSTTQSVQAG